MDSLMDKVVADISRQTEYKKQEILKELVEKAGYVWVPPTGRFPRLAKVIDHPVEYWFYDDGSLKGLFLVGFSWDFSFPTTSEQDGAVTTKATMQLRIHESCPAHILHY